MTEAKIANPIRDDIADTLFIPLYAKSVESRRNPPFFTDAQACRMVERVDYDFSKYDNAMSTLVGVAFVKFKLALDDDREIEQWPNNLKFVSVKHFGDFKEWRHCGFANYWIMKLVPVIKNAGRLPYYQIG